MAAVSPAEDTAGGGELKSLAPISAVPGRSASSWSCEVSQIRVGRPSQPTATNRPSLRVPMPMSQAPPAGGEAQVLYGEVPSHTVAVPSREAPTTRAPSGE